MNRGRPSGEIERITPGHPLWERLYPEHIQRYEFARACMPPGARVLDAGCGTGYGAAFLADAGAARVVATDLSAEALDTARREFDRANIEWILDDCHTLERVRPHAPFDLVCNLENLEHLAEPELFLRRVTAMLADDGVFVTSTPNRIGVNLLRGMRPDAPTTNPFHTREYTSREFHALLSPHFQSIRFGYQTMDPPERMELESAVRALWQNPAMRLGRWLQRAVRRRPVVERLDDLLAPARWRIVDESPGDARTITQLAVCRDPKR